ncbi:MAG: MFS transporter [Nitrososphaerales archaeon]
MTLTFGVTYSYSDFFIPLQREFGWSIVSDSSIPAVSLIVFSAGSLIGGLLVTRIGWRKTSIMGAAMTGTGLILSSQITSYNELLVMFGIVTSLGNAFAVICSGPIVVRWFVKRRGIAVGAAAAGSGIGTLVVPPIAENLIANYGWRFAFLAIGAFFLILLLGASYFMKTPEEVSAKPYGWEELTVAERSRIRNYSLKEALMTRRYWMIFAMFFLGTVGATMFVIHAVPFGATHGINEFYAALGLGVFGAGSLISRIVIGAMSDKMSRASTLVIALLSELIGLVALPFVSFSVWLFLACSFAIGFGYGGYLADFISLIGDLFGSRSIAGIWGFTEASYGAGGLLGPIIAGAYFAAYGTYTGIFELAAAGLFIAFVISLLFAREVNRIGIPKTV